MNFNKIGFIGLGLIGGSLAKSMKRTYNHIDIIALASRQSTIDAAFAEGVISNRELPPLEAFADCDVIFLCSPVKINVTYAKKLKGLISSHCILTDVGSVKGDITKEIKQLGLSDQFIGGHPMAGSEATGFSNARDTLLENAYYILTTDEDFDQDVLAEFATFIQSLGSIPLIMSPEKHDFATACISHLPHVIAASLVNFVKDNDTDDETLKTIAAGGFRDITRIASSSPVMWQHICATNRSQILQASELFLASLQAFIEKIAAEDEETIIKNFSSAKDYRDNLPITSTGVLPSVYEFYLDLADEAGGIATIATILASNNISIKNIGIVHNREFEQGVLRIEVYDADAKEKAIRILKKHYTVHE